MGRVYRARDSRTGRQVALKVPITSPGSEQRLVRLMREGQAVAALDHPNVVRIHDLGVVEGQPYLAYELLEDAQTLDAAWAASPLRQRIGWVRDAARALGHAHARGILHRDVKAENLLVDSQGVLRVADFGVAQVMALETLTQTGALLGTPFTMAPEQICGQRELFGPPADVWSLGVLLYVGLTERYPFEGESLVQQIALVTGAALRRPSLLRPDLCPELDRVCERALAKAPEKRYPTGEAFAAALDEVLERPTLTRLPRSRLPLGLAAALLLAVAGLAAAFALGRDAGASSEAEASPRAGAGSPAARRTPEQGPPRSPSESLLESYAVLSNSSLELVGVLGDPRGRHLDEGSYWGAQVAHGLTLLPEGRVASALNLSGPIRLWDQETGAALGVLSQGSLRTWSLGDRSAAGGRLLRGNMDGSLSLLATERETNRRAALLRQPGIMRQWPLRVSPYEPLAFGWDAESGAPSGRRVAAHLWDLEGAKHLSSFPGHAPIGFLREGQGASLDLETKDLARLDLRAGEVLKRVPLSAEASAGLSSPRIWLRSAVVAGPERVLIGAGAFVEAYDLVQGGAPRRYRLPFEPAALATRIAEPNALLVGGREGELLILDLETGASAALEPVEGTIHALALSDARAFALVGMGLASRSRVSGEIESWPQNHHGGSVRGLSWVEGGLFSGSTPGDLVSWDLEQGRVRWRCPSGSGTYLGAMHSSGTVAYLHESPTRGQDSLIRVDLLKGEATERFDSPERREDLLATTGSGALLVLDDEERLLIRRGASFEVLTDSVLPTQVATTRDGSRALVPTRRGIEFWDLERNNRVMTLARAGMLADLSEAPALGFLADGAPLSAKADGKILRWDLALGGPQTIHSGHKRGVFAVQASPDGRHVASLSEGELQLWELGSSGTKATLTLAEVRDRPRSLAWSPAGDRLAVGTDGGLVLVFKLRGR